MASTFSKVSGLREVGENMRQLKAEVALRVAGRMTNAGAQVIKKEAVANIISSPSVETGSLRDSVIVKKIPKSQTALTSEHIVTVRGRGKVIKRGKKKGQKETEAPHAGFVEFGTVNMPAEPFMRPAYDRKKEAAVEAMRDAGTKGVAAAVAKLKTTTA